MPEEIEEFEIEESVIQMWKKRVKLWTIELKFSLGKGLAKFD